MTHAPNRNLNYQRRMSVPYHSSYDDRCSMYPPPHHTNFTYRHHANREKVKSLNTHHQYREEPVYNPKITNAPDGRNECKADQKHDHIQSTQHEPPNTTKQFH